MRFPWMEWFMNRCSGICSGLLVFVLVLPVCLETIAQRYQFDPLLLQAIIKVESGGRPDALNHNHDGSWDIGLMQINSRWWAGRIAPQRLFEPCTNMEWGASILELARLRVGARWQAVGQYHGGSVHEQMRYMRTVFMAWKSLSMQRSISN